MRVRMMALLLGATLGTAIPAQAQFTVPAPVASGENFIVELGAGLWAPSARLGIQIGDAAASDIDPPDLAEALGLESERAPEFRLTLKPGVRHRFRFSYLPLHYEQQGVPESPVTFGAALFAAGEPVDADIRWDTWRLGYQYDLAATDRGLLGVILEARRSRVAATLHADQQTQALDERVTVPALGFIARGYIHRSVALTLEFAGFGVPGRIGRWITDDDLEVTMRDLDLSVTANPSRHLGLQGGYRRVRADYLMDQHRGDLRMSGWYGAAFVRF